MTDLARQADQLDASVKELTRAVEDLTARTRRNRLANWVLGLVVVAVIVLGTLFYLDRRSDAAEDCGSAREQRTEMEDLLASIARPRPDIEADVHEFYAGLPEPGACT